MTRFTIVTLFLFVFVSINATGYSDKNIPQKTITVTVDQKGWIFIGKDTLTTDQLAEELQKRLWKSYLGTGKMYHSIHLQHTGEVLPEIDQNVKKAIMESQQKALTDICLQLHKKLYEDLTNRQQRKIRNQFPVLFQQSY